jgi:hypothetical protein
MKSQASKIIAMDTTKKNDDEIVARSHGTRKKILL